MNSVLKIEKLKPSGNGASTTRIATTRSPESSDTLQTHSTRTPFAVEQPVPTMTGSYAYPPPRR